MEDLALLSQPVPKILVVDDEISVRDFLVRALQSVSRQVTAVASVPEAVDLMKSQEYDLVICDMMLGESNGMELLALARQAKWDVGFILISGQASLEHAVSAVRLQASDFLIKPFSVVQLRESVARSYRQLTARRESQAYSSLLESTLQRRTSDLEGAMRTVESSYGMTLETLVAALDAREHETLNHSFRVRAYATHLARAAGYPAEELSQFENGALLHDIGKIAVPDGVLLKRGPLTPEEWIEMKKHPEAGEEILRHVRFLKSAAVVVRSHHERYDGTGYPDQLAGNAIPLGARIFAFADTLDAMTSDRPYRVAPGYEAALREVRRCTGTQFDPALAEIFLSIPVRTWKALRAEAESAEVVRPKKAVALSHQAVALPMAQEAVLV